MKKGGHRGSPARKDNARTLWLFSAEEETKCEWLGRGEATPRDSSLGFAFGKPQTILILTPTLTIYPLDKQVDTTFRIFPFESKQYPWHRHIECALAPTTLRLLL